MRPSVLLAAATLTLSTPAIADNYWVDGGCMMSVDIIDGVVNIGGTASNDEVQAYTCTIASWPSDSPDGLMNCSKGRTIKFHSETIDDLKIDGVRLYPIKNGEHVCDM